MGRHGAAAAERRDRPRPAGALGSGSAKGFEVRGGKSRGSEDLPGEVAAPAGSARSPGDWAGDREEKGEFLKDNFLKHLISTDF